MKKILRTFIAGIVLLCLLVNDLLAQEPAFPVPTGNPKQLFYLQRTPDANTVVYEVKYVNNVFDTDDPVHPYWIRYTDNAKVEELTLLQRHFAYGVRTKKTGPDDYTLEFVAYKDIPIILKKEPSGKFAAYVTLNQKEAILEKIYLQINGGSFWSPNVEYAEFTGTDAATGATLVQRFMIKK